jgi:MFS family permease
LLVLAGPSMSVCNTSANSYLQATAPAQPRGRSVSLFMCAMRGGLSIASLLTGLTVSVLGVREALLINGILAVAGQIIVGRAWLRARVPKTSAWSRDRPTD